MRIQDDYPRVEGSVWALYAPHRSALGALECNAFEIGIRPSWAVRTPETLAFGNYYMVPCEPPN